MTGDLPPDAPAPPESPDPPAPADARKRLSVVLSALERRGAWIVPAHVDVGVVLGNAALDLREAALGPGTTTFDVRVTLGSLQLVVPPDVRVEVELASFAGNVEEPRRGGAGGPGARVVRVIGRVRFGNCEILAAPPGACVLDGDGGEDRHARARARHERRQRRHAARRARWAELHAERDMWRRERPHSGLPWWLMARMRRRIFSWLALAVGGGFALGWRLSGPDPRWWWIAIAALALSAISGGIAWRLTRPLILAIRAARDLGDGKLDTRIDTRHHGGEVRILGDALNDMAAKIQQQLADQRQLLAAVSHELRTPLGHMRVLIETARDQRDPAALAELEREVLVLDDLVGRLLASSRLEFGNLDRRPVDLGELVTDAAVAAGIDPGAIEADGDVRAAVDPTLVRRALANLLDNARLHGGGVVAVRVARRAATIAIEVDDAGPGILPERRADAFRAFVPSSAGGLGLGLALVSRIALAHGGGAHITDRPGGGTRATFTLGTVST